MRYVLTACEDNSEIKEARLEIEAEVEGTGVTFSFSKPRLCEIRFHRSPDSFNITYFYFSASEGCAVPYWAFYGSSGYGCLFPSESIDLLRERAKLKLAELAVQYQKELVILERTNTFLVRQYLLWEGQQHVAALELEIAELKEQGPILSLE